MNVLVGIETLIIALLAILVAGLLRSNAEVLRLLASNSHGPQEGGSHGTTPILESDLVLEAQDIRGTDLSGAPVEVSILSRSGSVLVAFLSSGCLTCEGFWKSIRDKGAPLLPGNPSFVIVTKSADEENLGRLLELGDGVQVPVVMSSEAWVSYAVDVSPFFVLVDGSFGTVVGAGAAESWKQVLSLVHDALGDSRAPERFSVGSESGVLPPSWKDEDVTEILAAAGVPPGHPSLYSDEWTEDQASEGEGDG